MKIGQVSDWLNAIAPFDSAESFDNVGLLMGSPNNDVTCVLFGMDLTEALADEALRLGAELIITHHPFIFHALKRIDYTGPQGRAMCKLMENRISVIAAHTNWDKAQGGVGDSLADALELRSTFSADEYVRVGTLSTPLSSSDFAQQITEKLRLAPRVYGAANSPISKIAVAGGAYGEGYEAAISAGAEAFVVGEIAHHEILDACERGLTVYEAGHFATEFPGIKVLYQLFLSDASAAGWPVDARLYDKAPFAGALLAF